jgi:L-gulonolactone oxidase
LCRLSAAGSPAGRIFAPPERIKAYYDTLQRFFEKYEGRPHWGKIHHCSPSYLRSVYPHFDRFLALRQKLDPNGIFLNEHLRELFGIPQAASIVSRL